MRPLCGAIITAGALIALGLAEIGYGIRYAGFHEPRPKDGYQWGSQSMGYLFMILCVGLMIGLGITFIGLMFHHYRRYHELLKHHGPGAVERVQS